MQNDGLTETALDEAAALAPQYYVGQNWLDFETSEILANHWQVVAPASLIAAKGDHIVREIAGKPVIILNTGDTIKGYFNICRHRAGPLALCDGKGTKALRCAYHGWTYGLEGNLQTTPKMRQARDFEKSDYSLWEIEVTVCGAFVFARLGKGPAFEDTFSGISDIVDMSAMRQMRHHHARVYDVAANWKVYVDNFLEGYHLPYIHPDLTQVVDYGEYKTELGDYWSLQRSPVDDSNGAYAAGEALYFFIYPNTMLNIMPDRVQTNRVIPVGLDRCKVEFDFYYLPGAETRADADDKFSDQVQEEDRLVCEHVQKGLTSSVYTPGRLSPEEEAGVWHFQNLLRRAYKARA